MKTAKAFLISILFISTVGAQQFGEVVGTTYQPMQNNGTAADRIAVGVDTSIYVCWMNLYSQPYPPSPRHIYHNWHRGTWNPNGFTGQVSLYSQAGYCNLDIIYGNRGAITYHMFGLSPYCIVSVDLNPPGLGFFDHYDPPDLLSPQNPDYPGRCFWPVIAVDRNDNIHLIMFESTPELHTPMRFGYTNSTNGGRSWSELALIDTVMVGAAIITASPVSDKVAIAYLSDHDTSTQWGNDVCYFLSQNGLSWDWENGPVCITDYDGSGYSLRADIETIFDYNDILHIAWSTIGNGGIISWHYNQASDSITKIAVNPDTIYDNWELSIGQLSLCRDLSESALFAVWCQISEGDTNIYGEHNGELYMSTSFDSGLSWDEPRNLTNTPSPDCVPPYCKSEIYPSAAEKAIGLPYITYMFNPNGGLYGGSYICSVMVACPEDYTDIDKNPTNLPSGFYLFQNYPNPFNSSTSIQYSLAEPAVVRLEIYDLLGRKVATLVNQQQPAGRHEIIWDAEEFTSGVYFIRLKAGEVNRIKQCLLLK